MDRVSYIIKKSLKKHNIYDFYALTLIANSPYFKNDSYVKGLCETVRKEIQDEMYNYDLNMVFSERAVRVEKSIRIRDSFKEFHKPDFLWEYLDEILTGKYDKKIRDKGAFSEPWRETWDAFKKVIQANNWNSFVLAFDHFVDQVHNNGSILDKFPYYIQVSVEIKKYFSDYVEGASKEVKKLCYQYERYEKGGNENKKLVLEGEDLASILLSDKKIKLPRIVEVEGDLDLGYTKITELPAGLHVGGFLELGNSNITELPAGLQVGDWLSLRDCKNITELPTGLHVGKNLDIRYTKIKKLPVGLKVGGDLYLNEFIEDIPEDAEIVGEVVYF